MSDGATITSTNLLDGLELWGDIVHEENSGFRRRFCPSAMEIVSVSWDSENMYFVYVLCSGEHISDSIKIKKWLDFLSASDFHYQQQ